MWWHRDHVWASRDQSVHNKMDLELSQLINLWVWVTDPQNGIRQKYREEKPVKKESLNSSLPGNMITRDENCKIVPSRAAAGRHVHAPGIPSCLTFCLLITRHTSHSAICSVNSARAPPESEIITDFSFLHHLAAVLFTPFVSIYENIGSSILRF